MLRLTRLMEEAKREKEWKEAGKRVARTSTTRKEREADKKHEEEEISEVKKNGDLA